MKYDSHKGFTLIELLVVIAIVAVLSVVVILTLNPAELLRQARDSNRISDMATIRSALSLYLADVGTPNLASSTISAEGYNRCYVTFATNSACNSIGFNTFTTVAGLPSTSTNSGAATSTAINASGWLPVNFTLISSGAPLGNLPLDPTNNGNYFYSYAATSTNLSFKLVAEGMESTKYGVGGANNVVSNDGGTRASSYEVGTNLNL